MYPISKSKTHNDKTIKIEFPGGCITSPSAEIVENIHLYGADRNNWLALFGHVCKQFNWVCHAHCLMDNHYYIVEETAEGTLCGVQSNGAYMLILNRFHNRVGHVFQGRYKAILVEKTVICLYQTGDYTMKPSRTNLACIIPRLAGLLKRQAACIVLQDSDPTTCGTSQRVLKMISVILCSQLPET
ncbi:MAG: hypothetical protein H6940_06565 [Burkholderiales bacterium]|nr:hypothetical protein [Burkholderiales bacterium]